MTARLYFVFLLWFLPFVIVSRPLIAQEDRNLYRVTDIIVDVNADNAVTAREKAFAEALHKGFEALLNQIQPDEQARNRIARPETAELGRMIQDFTTTNEKISGTRYIGTYELRFKPARVQAFLGTGRSSLAVAESGVHGQQGVSSDKTQQKNVRAPINNHLLETPTLILPFYQEAGQKPVLWESENPLRDALQQQVSDDPAMKFALGDLEDVQIFDESKGLSYNPVQLQALLQKYGAGQALIALGIPGQGGMKTLSIMFYRAGQTSPNPVYVDTLSMSTPENEARVILYARAAAQIRAQTQSLMTRSVTETSTTQLAQEEDLFNPSPLTEEADPIRSIPMRAQFESLMEWQKIRMALSAVPGVQSVRVLRLKTQEARIEVLYHGTDEDLLKKLEYADFLVSTTDVILESKEVQNMDSMPSSVLEPAAGSSTIITLALRPGQTGDGNQPESMKP